MQGINDTLTNEQIEFEMSKISEQIDKLYEKNEAYSKELRRREDSKVSQTNEILGIDNGVFVIAVARHLDYHLSLVKVYTRLEIDKHGFEFLLHDYRVDDYEYSYRVSSQRQYKSVFHDLISEYDIYTTDSPSSVDAIIKLFLTLGVKTDDYKKVIKGELMGSITGSITTV
jgi:hypothetical protein